MKTLAWVALAAAAFIPPPNAVSQTDTNLAAANGSSNARLASLRPVIVLGPYGPTVPAGRTISLSVALDPVLPQVSSGRLELWLKADTGVVTDAFARVRQWRDQSANRNDALQPSASLEPLLVFPPALAGRPAVRFEGTLLASAGYGGGPHFNCIGTYLQGLGQVNIPGAMTSFCVHMLAAPSTRECALWMVGETNPKQWGQCRADAIVDDHMDFSFWGGPDFSTHFTVPAGNLRIRTDRLAPRLDSIEMFDTSAAGTLKFTLPTHNGGPPGPGYYVGGLDPNETTSRNFDGDIAELIIYQGALDDAGLQAVTNYLRDKYFPSARLKAAAFQWRLGGTNIAGATNAIFVLANARPAMSGAYSVEVSDAAGVAASSHIVIAVTAAIGPMRAP